MPTNPLPSRPPFLANDRREHAVAAARIATACGMPFAILSARHLRRSP